MSIQRCRRGHVLLVVGVAELGVADQETDEVVPRDAGNP